MQTKPFSCVFLGSRDTPFLPGAAKCAQKARRTRFAASALAALTLISAAANDARAAAWSPSVALIPPTLTGSPGDVRSALGGNGATLAVWTPRYEGKPTVATALASFKSATGLGWSPATELPPVTPEILPNYNRLSVGLIYDVSLGDDGRATIAAQVSDGGVAGVVAWRYAPDSGWSQPIVVAARVNGGATGVRSEPDGSVTAVWLAGGTINGARLAADATEPVTVSRRLSGVPAHLSERFAIGPGGAVTAVVTNFRSGIRSRLLAYRLSRGAAAWSSPSTVMAPREAGGLVDDADVAANDTGGAVVVWQQARRVTHPLPHGSPLRYSVMARRVTAEGRWTAASRIATATRTGSEYQAITPLIGQSGFSAVLYGEVGGSRGSLHVRVVTSPSTSTRWTKPELVTARASYQTTVLAGVDGNHELVVVWGVPRTNGEIPMSATRSATGRWTAARIPGLPRVVVPIFKLGLTSGFHTPSGQLATDAGDHLVFGWRAPDAATRLNASVFY